MMQYSSENDNITATIDLLMVCMLVNGTWRRFNIFH